MNLSAWQTKLKRAIHPHAKSIWSCLSQPKCTRLGGVVVRCIVAVLQNVGANFNAIGTDICTAFFWRRNKPIHFIHGPIAERTPQVIHLQPASYSQPLSKSDRIQQSPSTIEHSRLKGTTIICSSGVQREDSPLFSFRSIGDSSLGAGGEPETGLRTVPLCCEWTEDNR